MKKRTRAYWIALVAIVLFRTLFVHDSDQISPSGIETIECKREAAHFTVYIFEDYGFDDGQDAVTYAFFPFLIDRDNLGELTGGTLENTFTDIVLLNAELARHTDESQYLYIHVVCDYKQFSKGEITRMAMSLSPGVENFTIAW